jgi:hypothetical protein
VNERQTFRGCVRGVRGRSARRVPSPQPWTPWFKTSTRDRAARGARWSV